MFARMSRYRPAAPGIRRPAVDACDRTGRQVTVDSGTSRYQFRGKNRMEQRTLNPRVRGSSPWRRTRTDLGFHCSRSFLCARFVPMLAPCWLVSHDRVAAGLSNLAGSGPEWGLRRLSRLGQWSTPLVDVLSFGSYILLHSVKPAESARSHERRTGRARRGRAEVLHMRR
jgi:hypothetical protein